MGSGFWWRNINSLRPNGHLMSFDLNNFSMWATAISGYLFVVLSIVAGINLWFKHKIKAALEELKPNHGSSIKDQVTRLEARVDEIYSILLARQ